MDTMQFRYRLRYRSKVSANFGFGIGPKPKQWFRSYTTLYTPQKLQLPLGLLYLFLQPWFKFIILGRKFILYTLINHVQNIHKQFLIRPLTKYIYLIICIAIILRIIRLSTFSRKISLSVTRGGWTQKIKVFQTK